MNRRFAVAGRGAAGTDAAGRVADRWSAPRSGAVALAAIVGVALSGCANSHPAPGHSSSAAASAARGHVKVGHIAITDGYIPQPASPDVAAGYLTITNTASTPDTITKIVANVTGSVMAMNETDHGGVGTMTNLASVTIPAHGRVSLTPGHAHLMLEHPATSLKAGQHVTIIITFAHAGEVRLSVPVVPL